MWVKDLGLCLEWDCMLSGMLGCIFYLLGSSWLGQRGFMWLYVGMLWIFVAILPTVD